MTLGGASAITLGGATLAPTFNPRWCEAKVVLAGGNPRWCEAKPLPRSAFADLLALWPRPKWGVCADSARVSRSLFCPDESGGCGARSRSRARSLAPTKVGCVALATARAPKARAPAAFFFPFSGRRGGVERGKKKTTLLPFAHIFFFFGGQGSLPMTYLAMQLKKKSPQR